jgi:hypothetical protein
MRRLLLLACAAACAAQTPLRLPNGLQAVLLELHESPLLRVEVRVPITAADLPPARPGLPELFLRTLRAGTLGRRSPEAFAATLEQNGVRLAARIDHGGLRLALLARSSDQELAFGLLADLLLHGSLENGALETQRLRLFQDAATHSVDELELLRLRAQEGPETPPTEQSLANIHLRDLLELRARTLRPERTRLVISGDLTPGQARQALVLAFGAWSPETAPAPFPIAASSAAPASRLAAVLPLPTPRLRPLLAPLLKEALPRLGGTGAPGDPWTHPQPAAEAMAAALARSPQAADLARVRSAWAAALVLQSLDPEARLQEALEPGPSPSEVQSVTLDELQAAWRGTLKAP